MNTGWFLNSPPNIYRDKRNLSVHRQMVASDQRRMTGWSPYTPLIYRLFCAPAGAQQPPFTCYISHVHAFLTHSFSCTPSPIRFCFARHNYWVQSLFNNLARLLLASGWLVSQFLFISSIAERPTPFCI